MVQMREQGTNTNMFFFVFMLSHQVSNTVKLHDYTLTAQVGNGGGCATDGDCQSGHCSNYFKCESKVRPDDG